MMRLVYVTFLALVLIAVGDPAYSTRTTSRGSGFQDYIPFLSQQNPDPQQNPASPVPWQNPASTQKPFYFDTDFNHYYLQNPAFENFDPGFNPAYQANLAAQQNPAPQQNAVPQQIPGSQQYIYYPLVKYPGYEQNVNYYPTLQPYVVYPTYDPRSFTVPDTKC